MPVNPAAVSRCARPVVVAGDVSRSTTAGEPAVNVVTAGARSGSGVGGAGSTTGSATGKPAARKRAPGLLRARGAERVVVDRHRDV